MKRLMLAVLVVTCASCVPDNNDSAVRLLGVKNVQGGAGSCQPSGNVQLTQGSLDISGYAGYLLGMTMESLLVDPTVEVNGENVASPGLNDVTFNEIVVQYQSEPAIGLPSGEIVLPTHFVLPAAAGDSSFLVAEVFTTEVAQQLVSSVTGSTQVRVALTLKLRGKLGSGMSIETNKISYSIVVFNSGFAGCATGTTRDQDGPCGRPSGQDGTIPSCSAPTAP